MPCALCPLIGPQPVICVCQAPTVSSASCGQKPRTATFVFRFDRTDCMRAVRMQVEAFSAGRRPLQQILQHYLLLAPHDIVSRNVIECDEAR